MSAAFDWRAKKSYEFSSAEQCTITSDRKGSRRMLKKKKRKQGNKGGGKQGEDPGERGISSSGLA